MAAQTLQATTSAQASPRLRHEQQPRLRGVGQNVVSPDLLDRRRFSIAVDSVHYYLEARHTYCAVLLTTTFLLRTGEKLSFADVPLIATPPRTAGGSTQPEDNADVIDISEHYPHIDEFVEVAHTSGTKDISLTPNVNVTVAGTSAGFSGVGVNKHRDEHKPYMISLAPVMKVIDDYPTSLSWRFEDPKGIFYPQSTKLLVIVTKSSDTNELWFPFELRLEWTLRVEIHGFLSKIVRLVVQPEKHDGWCFRIAGKYKEDFAKAALEDAKHARKTGSIPASVGLRAAAKQWIAAQTHAPSAPPSMPSAPIPP